MLTVVLSDASQRPQGAYTVAAQPVPPESIPGVNGIAVVVSTEAGDPDVVLPRPISAVTNAMGEASFMLLPSSLVKAGPDGSRLVYRIKFGRAFVDVEMPDRDTRLAAAFTP